MLTLVGGIFNFSANTAVDPKDKHSAVTVVIVMGVFIVLPPVALAGNKAILLRVRESAFVLQMGFQIRV
jgi:hypothetical protein